MSCREEEGEVCDNGEECSPVYVVFVKSWEEEFEVDFFHRRCGCGQFQENGYPFVHALFVLHQKNMHNEDQKCFIDKGYYRKSVSETCLTLSVGWMNKLQGLKGRKSK